jgi:hypothetical protein
LTEEFAIEKTKIEEKKLTNEESKTTTVRDFSDLVKGQ